MSKQLQTPPEEITLDFDATDNPVHGNQEKKFFHGYYGHCCFLPLYVFCGDQLLTSYLRPASRGDSGFCRHCIFDWCEKNNVHFICGIAKNSRLLKSAQGNMKKAATEFERTKEKQRIFQSFHYAAKSQRRSRKIIHKAEHSSKGANPRFIVTNLSGDPRYLYDRIYCARGEMENKIKEQLDFYADRTSSTLWWNNNFRLTLSSVAYVFIDTLRRRALSGTELARAGCVKIRLKLFKIGAVVIRNTRQIRLLLSEFYPFKPLFEYVYKKLYPT